MGPLLSSIIPRINQAAQQLQATITPATSATHVQLSTKTINLHPQLAAASTPFDVAAQQWAIAHELGHLHMEQHPATFWSFSLLLPHLLPSCPLDFTYEAYADLYSVLLLHLTPSSFKVRYVHAMNLQSTPLHDARTQVQHLLAHSPLYPQLHRQFTATLPPSTPKPAHIGTAHASLFSLKPAQQLCWS